VEAGEVLADGAVPPAEMAPDGVEARFVGTLSWNLVDGDERVVLERPVRVLVAKGKDPKLWRVHLVTLGEPRRQRQ
jgi:hypothetical protein